MDNSYYNTTTHKTVCLYAKNAKIDELKISVISAA